METLEKKIIEFWQNNNIKHKNLQDLAQKLSKILGQNFEDVFSSLKKLENDGEIFAFVRSKYALASSLNMKKGKLSLKENFGFVVCEGGDIFVAKKNLGGAIDGDIVLCKIVAPSFGGRRSEGKIVKIVARESENLVGTFLREGERFFVDIDGKKMRVAVHHSNTMGAVSGDKVVLNLIGCQKSMPVGKVVEVIGSLSKTGNDIKWLLKQYKIRDVFPDDVINQAKKCPQVVNKSAFKERIDLTAKTIFTIDGADAKDLDDAVSLEIDEKGLFHLGVHIADVGEYVKFESPLDVEAFERGTSIYFLNKVIPMLPKELSNGICSLNEGVDRLALSVEMTIDKNGDVVESKIFESIINSCHRLNYDEVLEVIEGNKKTRERLKDIAPILDRTYELSQVLQKRRNLLGALDFDLPEGQVVVDENNFPIKIEKRKSTKSTRIIETFMVAANETVAKFFEQKKIPFVFRIHEKPDPEKMRAFYNFAETLGVSVQASKKDVEPKDLQSLLEKVEDKSICEIVNMMMLRSLKKAKYCETCVGHFGLALTYYCHFTSPIRRYPDLTIHRIIKEFLHGNNGFVKSVKMADFVVKSATKSSIQEKNAEEVERAIVDYKKCEYMSQFVGQNFEGVICSISPRGFFVQLENTCEGFVNVASLKDDFYTFDEQTQTLSGSANSFRLGQKVQVKLVGCNLPDRKIDFEVVKRI